MALKTFSIVLMLLSLMLCFASAQAQAQSGNSQEVIWSCTGSPCPWGGSLTGQALVWPPALSALTERLGYTTSEGIYLPAPSAEGITVRITAGTANIYAGYFDVVSHELLATLNVGNEFTIPSRDAGEVLSVQSQFEFAYTLSIPIPPTPTSTSPATTTTDPSPTSTAISAVTFDMTNLISTTQTLADEQIVAWSPDTPTGTFFLSLGSLVTGSFVFMFIKALVLWRHGD